MSDPTRPRGVAFAYARASKALDDQLAWIDALDTKAGVLLAAGGVIAGLVLTGDSILQWAPPILTILIVGFLIGSVILSLSSFATRHYETGPDAADLAARMQHLGDAGLQQLAIPPLLEAIDINDSKVNQKAALLSYSGICLMLGTFFISLYYLYSVMDS